MEGTGWIDELSSCQSVCASQANSTTVNSSSVIAPHEHKAQAKASVRLSVDAIPHNPTNWSGTVDYVCHLVSGRTGFHCQLSNPVLPPCRVSSFQLPLLGSRQVLDPQASLVRASLQLSNWCDVERVQNGASTADKHLHMYLFTMVSKQPKDPKHWENSPYSPMDNKCLYFSIKTRRTTFHNRHLEENKGQSV